MAEIKEIVSKNKNVDFKSLIKCIAKKKQSIEKLEEEYNSLKANASSKRNKSPENMKSSFCMLKAQIKVLNSIIPLSVPNCQRLMFAYVHRSLRKEVNNLEELILFQKQMLLISLKKSHVLKQLCEREHIDYDSTEVSSFQKMSIEKEKTRSEMLECLHRKLAHRLRRITKQFYSAVHTEEEKIKNSKYLFTKEKRMLYILEKLLPELSHNSAKSNEWKKPICIRIDESFPKNYVQLLLDHQIVELFKGDPFCLKLIRSDVQ